jgi:RES domain-containing protein
MGAFLNGGRWNYPGNYVVYTAESRSLAILEMLVHLDLQRHFPGDRIMAEIEIPDSITPVIYNPPVDPAWRMFPHHDMTQKVFREFIKEGKSPVLAVPSAVVPQEYNYLLNPMHGQFGQIAVKKIDILDFDKRLVHRF